MILFRFPFEDEIKSVAEEKGTDKVEFHPFYNGKTVCFKGKIITADINSFDFPSDLLQESISDNKQENKAEYIVRIQDAIHFIEEHHLKKLVTARKIHHDFQGKTVDLKQSFLSLCKEYPNAFCYLFLNENECWMGAFSELLGKFDKQSYDFETMSLAGTLPKNEPWTEKEILEQKPVTDYISNILKEFSHAITQSEVYDHISGNIKHLRTDFKAKINPQNLDQLVSQLHPTPAVCGIPKEICREEIVRTEPFSRKLYAGYIRIEDENSVQCFVNLRCAELFANSAHVYAGGGITSLSNPEKEWRETELKSNAIIGNLRFFS